MNIFTLSRRKLSNKLKESEDGLSTMEVKYTSLEKTKKHIAQELEDLNIDLEKVHDYVYIRSPPQWYWIP